MSSAPPDPARGSPAVFAAICRSFDDNNVEYTVLEHEAVQSTPHAAALRGLTTAHAAKCLVMKLGRAFAVVTFPAHRRLDNRALRQAAGVGKLRFARREELWDSTGLVTGCVPPFGPPVLPFPLWVDQALVDRCAGPDRRLAFTPGLLDRSILVDVGDWLATARGTVAAVSQPSP